MQENDYKSSTTSSRGGVLSKLRMKIDVLFKARSWNVEPLDLWNLGTLGLAGRVHEHVTYACSQVRLNEI
jgi:hypothetical protein